MFHNMFAKFIFCKEKKSLQIRFLNYIVVVIVVVRTVVEDEVIAMKCFYLKFKFGLIAPSQREP